MNCGVEQEHVTREANPTFPTVGDRQYDVTTLSLPLIDPDAELTGSPRTRGHSST